MSRLGMGEIGLGTWYRYPAVMGRGGREKVGSKVQVEMYNYTTIHKRAGIGMEYECSGNASDEE